MEGQRRERRRVSAQSNSEQQHTRRALDVGSAPSERCGGICRAYRLVPRLSQLSGFTQEAGRTASSRREKTGWLKGSQNGLTGWLHCRHLPKTNLFRRQPLARPSTQSSPDAQEVPGLSSSELCWQDAVHHGSQDGSISSHPAPPQLVSTQTTIRASRNVTTTPPLSYRLDRKPSAQEHRFQQQSLVVLGPEQHNPFDTCALSLSLAGADTLR